MGKRKKKKKKGSSLLDQTTEEEAKKIPRSFIFKHGKISKPLFHTLLDMRNVMMPNTAINLKERRSNRLKDFVQVAGPLGITHFQIFSATESGSYLKIARLPQGPTLKFKILQYSSSKDVFKLLSNPVALPSPKFPAVLICSGFNEHSHLNHIDLMRITFKEMFPAISVQEIKLERCRRTVLFEYNAESDTIEFRHYWIDAKLSGVSKSIKKIVDKPLLDLSEYEDISEYALSGLGPSESDTEDSKITEERSIRSVTTHGKRKKTITRQTSTTKSIRLREIGPRLKLQLIKIQQGLCSGEEFYQKPRPNFDGELSVKPDVLQLKEAYKKKLQAEREKKKALQREEKEKNKSVEVENNDAGEQEENEDIDWYIKEVGEEPDKEVKESLTKNVSNSQKYVPKKRKRPDKEVELPKTKRKKVKSKKQRQNKKPKK